LAESYETINHYHYVTTEVPKLSLTMSPFSISIDEHVPLKFLLSKSLKKTKIYLPISIPWILKIIFADIPVCANNSK